MKKKTRGKRLLGILLCFVMVLSIIPTTAFAAEPDTRTKVSSVTATSNISDVLKYNGANERPTFNFTDGIVRFSPSMGGWKKKNGSSWDNYEETTFTEGTYNYRAQMRIDSTTGYGTTHVLDIEGVTIAVNGVNWTVGSVMVYDTYSWVWVNSPVYTVSSSGTHAHSWENTWDSNSTHHWHNCTASGCDITDNSQKSGYAAHSGGTANCVDKAVCSTCGESYGTTNPDVHRSTSWTAKYDGTHHWTELNCCNAILNAKQAHTYDDDADATCNFTNCGYVRTITHTCATTTLTAVAKADATHFDEGKQAYYRCSCGEYYEDATATTKITDISTWGVINKTPHQLSGWMHDDANTKHWKECTISGCTHKEQEGTHDYADSSDTTCDTCGYERSLAPATYTVTFNNNGHGTAPATQTVESGNKATEPTALVEEGWTFGGWYEDATFMVAYDFDTSVTSNITLYAKWTEDSVTPPTIAIVEGNGSEWTKGTNADLTFKSNANFADFTRVEVDGAKVDASNYTKSEGSTIVTLKASFLETLSVGEHTIVIVSANDVPEAKFTVKAAATGGNTGNEQNPDTGVTSPQTGDSSNMFLWIALLFVSLGGLTTTVVYKKRKAVKE